MTGEWFYETKQLRHQDRIHGSEIIRASMKHSHKPLTIREASESCIAIVEITEPTYGIDLTIISSVYFMINNLQIIYA